MVRAVESPRFTDFGRRCRLVAECRFDIGFSSCCLGQEPTLVFGPLSRMVNFAQSIAVMEHACVDEAPNGQPVGGYPGTVTSVILSAFATCRILASPTTEPGRRGWKRRLGSPHSTPHFFAHPTHPNHYPPSSRPNLYGLESKAIEFLPKIPATNARIEGLISQVRHSCAISSQFW